MPTLTHSDNFRNSLAGSVKILELLLDHGADPNAQSDAGPPLLWACGHGKVAAAGVLLTRGANPDTPSEDGVTSLLTATAAGETEIVKLLLQVRFRVAAGHREQGFRCMVPSGYIFRGERVELPNSNPRCAQRG
ncbi:unnamed protein product [Closterium sp. NIES-54]